MQIKKYSGSSLKEASDKMKMELGDEAIILSSRLLENLPGRKLYEITAGIESSYDYQIIKESPNPERTVKKNRDKELSEKLLMVKKLSEKQPETDGKVMLSQTDKLKKLIELLLNHELNKKIVTTVIDELKKYKEFLHSSNIDNYVLSSLSSLVPIHKFSFSHGKNPFVVALIGPTGVGKTTCIAKLAAISKIIHNLDVGLISTDTYRLGAIDQLKIFSEISNIDMLVAYEPEDMSKAYETFRKKDIIFIDTAGRSQKNSEQLAKTQEFLKTINVDESYLVMSATSSTKTLNDIAEKFELFNPKAAIFTKLDEAAAFGNIINIASGHNLPVVYLSNGQVIPDDIIAANADFIANIAYKGRITS
jgi:flagellar biosynthesis protein FlhF